MLNTAAAIGEAAPVCGVPRRCPICGGDAVVSLFENRMVPCAGFDFSTVIQRCASCDSAFAGNTLRPQDLHRYYASLSKYDTLRTRADISTLDLERASLATVFLAPILGLLSSVLDVGCSSGVLLHALREAGVKHVRGIDPAADASAVARALFDVPVVQAPAESFDSYGDYDLVCLMAVLEHLLEPRALLSEIGRQLKPGGRVLIEVPDAGAFDRPADSRPIEPFGEFSNEHINFLAISDVSRLGRSAGLEVERWWTLRIAYGAPDLFVLLRRASDAAELPAPDAGSATSRLSSGEAVPYYVARSQIAMDEVERRLRAMRREKWLIYGAGNHTGRLLAQSPVMRNAEVLAIFDRNHHLHGAMQGGIPILPPERIADFPGVPVLISTFNARHEIHAALKSVTNQPLVLLYD